MKIVTNISVTGHRPSRLDGYDLGTDYYDRLRRRMTDITEHALLDADELVLHSGMALGADTCWAQVALAMADRDLPVRLHAHVPYPTQPARWKPVDARRWNELIARADKVKTYAEVPSIKALYERNTGLIRVADLVVAVYDGGSRSGTASTVRKARARHVPVEVIDPRQV